MLSPILRDRFFTMWPAGVAVLFLASCSSKIDYAPKTDRVQVLGLEAAKAQLTETLLRSRHTGFGDRLLVESLWFSGKTLIVNMKPSTPSGGLDGTGSYQNIPLEKLERVDVYSSNWAYVYIVPDICVLKVLLATPDDARQFADLLMSFHTEFLD